VVDDATTGDPTLKAGFASVDSQPDPARLIAGMETTATWPSVKYLRTWERERLRLRPGDRLLDVGCGLGDAADALSAEVMPGGAVVGVDASDAMLAVARSRAPHIDFHIADALALDEPSSSFDACRSERMLQWVPDVDRAIGEMVRVLRPGGRLSLIDSDWRTLVMDIPDTEATAAVMDAMRQFRGASAFAGGLMLNICRDHGVSELECAGAAHVWTEWNPDESPAPQGLFPLRAMVPQLADLGLITPELGRRFVESAEDAARRNRLCISLTMFAVSGIRA
jgi:SAM-dependent methyltransferase